MLFTLLSCLLTGWTELLGNRCALQVKRYVRPPIYWLLCSTTLLDWVDLLLLTFWLGGLLRASMEWGVKTLIIRLESRFVRIVVTCLHRWPHNHRLNVMPAAAFLLRHRLAIEAVSYTRCLLLIDLVLPCDHFPSDSIRLQERISEGRLHILFVKCACLGLDMLIFRGGEGDSTKLWVMFR